MANMFKTDRLLFRALEQKDEPFLLAVTEDSESRINSAALLPTPPGPLNASNYRAYLDNCFMSAVVCLQVPPIPTPSSVPPPTTTLATATAPHAAVAPIPIGTVSLYDSGPRDRHHRQVRLGISFAREYQGNGYGTETLQWTLHWAFHRAAQHKVYLEVYEFNARAIRVYERVGFVREGRLREHVWHDGRFWDVLIYGILEGEWRARNGVAGEVVGEVAGQGKA